MIFGTDTSRYQPLGTYDPGDFEIINVQDPGLQGKVDADRAAGRPWGLYTWVYPGGGGDAARRADASERLGEKPPLGFWLDYEDAGVTPADLDEALELVAGQKFGVYTYLYAVGSVADVIERWGVPLWLAYYSGGNDGSYPEGRDGDARDWNAVLWQYTSGANAPVGLDRNVVIDEGWYRQWLGVGDDDLTPEQAQQLQELHTAVTGSLVSPGVEQDTTWIHAYLNGAYGSSLEARIRQIVREELDAS